MIKCVKQRSSIKNDYVIIVLFFLIIKQSNKQTIKQSNNKTNIENKTIKQT